MDKYLMTLKTGLEDLVDKDQQINFILTILFNLKIFGFELELKSF